jgi:6-phosphogluconolactonase
MAQPNLRIFPALDDLSREAAGYFRQRVHESAGDNEILTVAFSGGSTPKRMLEILSTPGFANDIPWSKSLLFQVDERHVPPDHPESNAHMMRQALFSKVPEASAVFHRMKAEHSSPDEAAREYAFDISRSMRVGPAEFPRFGLIFLGMGPDGHTASLFPGSGGLVERERWVIANYVERLQTYRITTTYPVLNNAAQIVFLVAGADKAEVLRDVLEGPPGRYPVQAVKPVNGSIMWYVDEAAASQLRHT